MVGRGVVRSFFNTRIPVLGTIRLIAFVALILLTGCKKEAPVETTPPPKDPRTYTWSVDTIEYPGSFQTLMYDIWGATPTDVFAVGYNDIGGAGVMYHFNGTTWNHVPLNTQLGGQIAGAFVLNAIHGLAAKNIWAVGERIYINRTPPPNFLDSSLIIRFDGNAWREAPSLFTANGVKQCQSIFYGCAACSLPKQAFVRSLTTPYKRAGWIFIWVWGFQMVHASG